MKLYRKILGTIVVIFGAIAPFIGYWVVLQAFFLLIPFLIGFITSLIIALTALINKKGDKQKTFFAFSLFPLFIVSQFLSAFVVNIIQKKRSELIIAEVQKLKNETGKVPENLKTSFGIAYTKLSRTQDFVVSYSRGFLVTEKYESHLQSWKSYGWND